MEPVFIERLAYGGDSVGRLSGGKTAFVSGGCPGDTVLIEVLEEKERFVRARVADVLEPSPSRVSPPCPYFGVCGGCQWQHVAYALQLAAKRESVVDAFKRIGHLAHAADCVAETVSSSKEYGYRNKIELVADETSRRLTLGYHKAGSADVVPVDLCLLLPERQQKIPKALTGALRYLSGETDLGITRVEIRVGARTKDLEVALWTPPGGFPRAAAARTLGQALPLTSLVRVLHKGPVRQRDVAKVEVLSGKGHWSERLSGLRYAVSAPSFFQVNTPVAEKMVELVLSELSPDGSDRVLDLFAGAGTFTLPLAGLAGETIAIESYGPAVRDLRRNLDDGQLWAEVIGGDVEREIASLGHFDLAVVDPPRAGLGTLLTEALASAKPRTLVYVSCDPATLARDARSLERCGMRLVSATPFDLFPQTYHIETVATFRPM